MRDAVKSVLAKLTHLAYQVAKAASAAQLYRTECAEIKTKAEHLAFLLRQAARFGLYGIPAARVTEYTAEALSKALSLVSKCCGHGGILQRFTKGNNKQRHLSGDTWKQHILMDTNTSTSNLYISSLRVELDTS